MKVQKFIEVRLNKKRIIPVIDVVQYDTGVQLVFSLVDFDIPSGTSATLYVQKRSGRFVYQEKNITVSGNEITVDLENQALTEHGETKYQVKLKNGTDTITTFAGVLRVEKSLADANAVESKTVIRAFDELTADKLAEFRAEAEVIAQNVIATIPEDYTVMEAKVNELANGIKGNLSGTVVFADDVSPVEHIPIVKVHGKNLVPYGTITFTKNKSILLDNPLPEGTYTISAHITSNDTDSEYSAVSINNKSEVMKYIALKRGTRVSSTFTVTKPITNIDFCAAYNYNQGETDSATWADIQIEEGTVATEYEPYIDPSTVKVKRCCKNMVTYPYNEMSMTRQGITFTVANDGRITVNGTSTGAYLALIRAADKSLYLHKDQTYFFSCVPSDGGYASYYAYVAEEEGEAFFDLGKGVEFTPTKSGWGSITVVVKDGTAVSNVVFNPILEIGKEKTAFEPYNGTEYIPAADGTVSGLTSVSPCMTIMTDTEGTIVECEYIKDTNKVVEKLTNAIIALGGTV